MNLIEAIESLYPGIRNLEDFTIRAIDDRPFIDLWVYSGNMPTKGDLLALGYNGPFLSPQEAHMAEREQQFISEVRRANRQLWDSVNTLKSLQREYAALDYTNTLDEGRGENIGITAAEISALLFTTTNAIDQLLDAGHATNMAKLL